MTNAPQNTIPPDRYTLRGNNRVEARIAADMDQIVEKVCETFEPDGLHGVVLLGGYGRGEGGALVENGEHKPHNNYDILVLVDAIPWRQRGDYYMRAGALGTALGEALGLGVDLNVRPVGFLHNATHILINHDLRFGHRVLWGDPNIIDQMPAFEKSDVPMTEGAALLRNRGNCLLENRMALHKGTLRREQEMRKFIRHIFKATIGYGDAVLIAKGWYDTSYATKLERVINLDLHEVPQADLLKAIYKEAAEFRFEPNYPKYLDREPSDWLQSVLAVLEPVHLWFEQQRLGRDDLTWEKQFYTVTARGFGIRYGLIKRVRNTAVNLREFGLLNALGDYGWWALRHPRERLLAAFPALLYRPSDWDYPAQIGPLLGTGGDWSDTADRYQALYKTYLM